MESVTDLTITVRVDTEEARREVAEFRLYALRVIEELRAAYASLAPGADISVGVFPGPSGLPGRRV